MGNMSLPGRRIFVSAFLFTLLVLSGLTGCRTAPRYSVKNYPALVFRKDSVFVHFNLEEDRRIMEKILEIKDPMGRYGRILERTSGVSAALQPSGIYTAVAEGRYPKTVMNIMIGTDERWVKHKKPFTWWENRDDGTCVSVPSGNLAVISNGTVLPVLNRLSSGDRTFIPQGVNAQMLESPLVVFASDPEVNVFSVLGLKNINAAVDELDLFLLPAEEGTGNGGLLYRLYGYADCGGEDDVSVLTSGLKIFFLSSARGIGKSAVKEVISGKKFFPDGERIKFNGVLIDVGKLLEDRK